MLPCPGPYFLWPFLVLCCTHVDTGMPLLKPLPPGDELVKLIDYTQVPFVHAICPSQVEPSMDVARPRAEMERFGGTALLPCQAACRHQHVSLFFSLPSLSAPKLLQSTRTSRLAFGLLLPHICRLLIWLALFPAVLTSLSFYTIRP